MFAFGLSPGASSQTGLPRGTRRADCRETMARNGNHAAGAVRQLVCGAILLAAALAGNELGGLALPSAERPQLARLLLVLLNLYCLYFAVGGLAWLVSSLSNRRGRAMTIVFLILPCSCSTTSRNSGHRWKSS